MQTLKSWILVLSIGLLAAGCGSSDKPADLTTSAPGKTPQSGQVQAVTGAGSSFVYPAMSKWAYAYNQAHPEVTINYQSVGSGAGISAFKQGTVDFGATDVA